jgi:transcriptional regulator with XRE-family HTH domain
MTNKQEHDWRTLAIRYREDHHLTQQQLAKQLHIERNTVSRWENGKYRVPSTFAWILANEYFGSSDTSRISQAIKYLLSLQEHKSSDSYRQETASSGTPKKNFEVVDNPDPEKAGSSDDAVTDDMSELVSDLVNTFIEKWCGENAAHLIDTDDNDGEYLRQSIMALISQERKKAKIEGMRKARLRVLRRTEVPKDARNPTRDYVVILGEQIADIIEDDIKQLRSEEKEES